MINVRVDNQYRNLILGVSASCRDNGVANLAITKLNTVLALRREPAAIKRLRCDNELATFLGGPVEAVVNTFLGELAHYAGRNNDDQNKKQN